MNREDTKNKLLFPIISGVIVGVLVLLFSGAWGLYPKFRTNRLMSDAVKYASMGDHNNEIATLKKAVEINHESDNIGVILNYLGDAYARNNQNNEAFRTFNIIINLPNDKCSYRTKGQAYYRVAILHYSLGDLTSFLKSLENAKKQFERNDDSFGLSMIQHAYLMLIDEIKTKEDIAAFQDLRLSALSSAQLDLAAIYSLIIGAHFLKNGDKKGYELIESSVTFFESDKDFKFPEMLARLQLVINSLSVSNPKYAKKIINSTKISNTDDEYFLFLLMKNILAIYQRDRSEEDKTYYDLLAIKEIPIDYYPFYLGFMKGSSYFRKDFDVYNQLCQKLDDIGNQLKSWGIQDRLSRRNINKFPEPSEYTRK